MSTLPARDPFRFVQKLGRERSVLGLVPWLVAASLTHTGAVASPAMTMLPMRKHMKHLREELRAYYAGVVDIDVSDEPAPPPAEEPEPEAAPPEEAPPAVDEAAPPLPTNEPPPPAVDEDPYAEAGPAPAAAEAADVLDTGPADEGEDLGAFTIVNKDGSRATGGGYTSAKGTSQTPVRDPRARSSGVDGGKGAGGGTKPANLSRPAMPRARSLDNCPFPPQAELAQIERAVVEVAVTVDASGVARAVRVQSDPGYGFAGQAKRCALAMSYEAARDAAGQPATGLTPTLRFRFQRR